MQHVLSHSNEVTDQQVKRACTLSLRLTSQGQYGLTSKTDDATGEHPPLLISGL